MKFTGFDDGAAEYVDEATGEAYYHRPSWRTPMNDETKPKKSATALAPTMTPMAMIEQAIQGKADVAVLASLMSLQERWEANEAKKDFDLAIAEAKSKMPEILKKTPANFGKFANLEEITKIVTPILSEEGLSHRYRSDFDGHNIIVTCIIAHKRGHREESRLPSGPDTSGGKNAIQAIGSACTYLQRYTLLMSLGLAPAKDDDGDTAGPAVTSTKPASPPMQNMQYDSLLSLMKEAGVTPEQLLEHRSAQGTEKLTDLTQAQYFALEKALKKQIQFNKGNKPKKAPPPTSSTDQQAPPQPGTNLPAKSQPGATAEAAYQMGKEAQAKGAAKGQYPGFWKDQENIAQWQRGWSDAEDEMTSARAVDKETSRDND
jgi:hypothetical protein